MSVSQGMSHRLAQRIELLLDYGGEEDDAEVPDPYYGSMQDFEHALDLIEDGCEGLLEYLTDPCTLRGAAGEARPLKWKACSRLPPTKVFVAMIVNPIGIMPVFVAMTVNQTDAQRHNIAHLGDHGADHAGYRSYWARRCLKCSASPLAAFKVGRCDFDHVERHGDDAHARARDKQTPEEPAKPRIKPALRWVPLGFAALAGPGAMSTIPIYASEKSRAACTGGVCWW